jgi:hypothetical protein
MERQITKERAKKSEIKRVCEKVREPAGGRECVRKLQSLLVVARYKKCVRKLESLLVVTHPAHHILGRRIGGKTIEQS